MLAFSNCPKCSTKNVEIVPDGAAHRDYAAKCDGCGLLYQVQGSNSQSSRAFDYEDGFGRLMLTKSSCFEMLDEYVRERGVRRKTLADWLNSLPWEMEGDGDAGLDLHVVWEEGGVLSLSDPETLARAQFGEPLRRGA